LALRLVPLPQPSVPCSFYLFGGEDLSDMLVTTLEKNSHDRAAPVLAVDQFAARP
jgi:sugar lactone lactonase YvrE